ncbi:hypothetical protein GCM10010435_82120 [Winogradskya consettensis]|uniref:Uncharacterized protein n=1 Tax=Winogradskya consettensis TaxID=113560 RepID=A0A919SUY9_9ACTN|nr:hypothetical protein [Actinoplanes consettensis]GIM79081.1 hypothetical protein Aco04nite_63700 [Actinoplanes consettensis]
MPHPLAKVHRMFELVEPIGTVTFSEVPNEAFLARGMRNYWDGHNAVLVAHNIGGTEAHVLLALTLGEKAETFGRTHHLPKAQLAAVIDGLRDRGILDTTGEFTAAGRQTRQRIETLTDELAAPAYEVLGADELDELIAGLEPVAAAVSAGES